MRKEDRFFFHLVTITILGWYTGFVAMSHMWEVSSITAFVVTIISLFFAFLPYTNEANA